ncbi:hypothetical protein ETI06_00570 [Macrococcoides goetzii]|nr:hypothetical protein [Macrococcus goetzii]TDM41603.1 hypothetical protein ETI10_00515 [Macrococcus goetzii]TDM50502.1 hypothetical protein ETI06_00570 [Macrococcus goetzii]
MKNLLKVGIASTLLLGLTPAVADAKTPVKSTTKTVTPYYKWNGYTGYSHKFVLDKDFKRALLNSNVKVNGMKVTKSVTAKQADPALMALAKYNEHKKFNSKLLTKKYDTLGLKAGKEYFVIQMPVQKGKVSLAQIKKLYGKYEIEEGQLKDSKTKKFYTESYVIRTESGSAEFHFDKNEKLNKVYILSTTTINFGY